MDSNTTRKSIGKGHKIRNLQTPAKEGYTFTGWFTDVYSENKINENEIIKEDVIYYAHFQ